MVGPGEVDSDLEPEVREECHTKYGEVQKVIIFELPEAEETEAVRIFVEFKRIEAAIKAVIDLNGRFFAGRQVKAGFYDVERFLNMELNDWRVSPIIFLLKLFLSKEIRLAQETNTNDAATRIIYWSIHISTTTNNNLVLAAPFNY